MPEVEHLGQYDAGPSYKKIISGFILAVIVISLGAVYFVLSRVTITLLPKTETKELSIDLTLDSQSSGIDFDNNIIHGVLLSKENQKTVPFNNIPPKRIEENATGELTIHNGYTRAQGFKKGEVLVTTGEISPQKVALKENAIVYRNQTKTVAVSAVEKGIAGQIPPSQFVFEKYDDFMNEHVKITSAETFSGGVRTATLVTENDIEVARNKIFEEIVEKNFSELNNDIREGEELYRENSINTITSFHSSVAAPFETDHFEINMTAKTTVAIFKKADLLAILENKLRNMADNNQEFLGYSPEDLSFKVRKLSTENQSADLEIKINGKFQPKLSTKIFNKDEIKGYNKRALEAHYRNFDDLERIKVRFWPSFRKTVPEMNSRIIIEIQN
ncbi:MAG: hypothetical protein U9Q72_02585 [Patescibacteria group bacterium]|nr:hypothetical protein [Patescibacteria group bacterium]